MDNDRKKELKKQYKSAPVTGGICCIRCSGNRRTFVQATNDIRSLRNRYEFAVSMGGCPDPSLLREWKEYGVESFSFEVLEELKKGDDQSDSEFAEDIDLLYELWKEKNAGGSAEPPPEQC